MSAGTLLHAVVLLLGSLVLSVMSENVAGRDTFSLPLSNILLVTLVGTTLSVWWSWPATLSTLTVYAIYSVVAGLLDRSPYASANLHSPL